MTLSQTYRAWRLREAHPYARYIFGALCLLAILLDAVVLGLGAHLLQRGGLPEAHLRNRLIILPHARLIPMRSHDPLPQSGWWFLSHGLALAGSIGVFGLAWGAAILHLALLVWAPRRYEWIQVLSNLCLRSLQVGAILLAGATLLGGFWSMETWDRFWSWEPRELWEMLTLACFLLALAARHLGWVRDFGMALAASLGFAFLVTGWFALERLFGAGLRGAHLGGHDVWIYWGGLVNGSLTLHAALVHLGRRRGWTLTGG
jgi:hypothetical protein